MTPRHRKPVIALIVPDLCGSGGVPAVARFLKNTILNSERFDLKLISLAMGSRDHAHLLLGQPLQWHAGAKVVPRMWEDLPVVHIGAICGEIEFQNYRPRRILTSEIAGCDVIQVVCGSPAWANSVCGLGLPVSLHVATRARVERRLRDRKPRDIFGWWRKSMTGITDRMDDKALSQVDAIQVMNSWMFDYARQRCVEINVDIRYAPPGVDSMSFRPRESHRSFETPYVLCVARFDDTRKNIGLLLEAYALLPESLRASVRLVLAGSSGPPEAFWRRADLLGLRERIAYVAYPDRDEIISLYQGATIFALPSEEEGFGVVLLEAMACGVPVVSTRSGGPEGIITDGRDGYLVAPDDAVELSDRLWRLLKDEQLNLAMGQEARRTIESRFSEEVTGKAFIHVWDNLLAKAGKI